VVFQGKLTEEIDEKIFDLFSKKSSKSSKQKSSINLPISMPNKKTFE
jgi:hypothetical protein